MACEILDLGSLLANRIDFALRAIPNISRTLNANAATSKYTVSADAWSRHLPGDKHSRSEATQTVAALTRRTSIVFDRENISEKMHIDVVDKKTGEILCQIPRESLREVDAQHSHHQRVDIWA